MRCICFALPHGNRGVCVHSVEPPWAVYLLSRCRSGRCICVCAAARCRAPAVLCGFLCPFRGLPGLSVRPPVYVPCAAERSLGPSGCWGLRGCFAPRPAPRSVWLLCAPLGYRNVLWHSRLYYCWSGVPRGVKGISGPGLLTVLVMLTPCGLGRLPPCRVCGRDSDPVSVSRGMRAWVQGISAPCCGPWF